MIAITGATGNIGRHLTRLLATAGAPTRLILRDPAKADAVAGVEVVAADLDAPDTLDAALKGATHLFLMSPGPNTPAQDAAAIGAAQRTGVRHVVLLSSLGIEAGGIGGGRPHAPGEETLKKSGLAWTILRPSEYMTNTLWWLNEAKARGTVSIPSGNGKVGLIDPADIASVAFSALTNEGINGATYRLTGPELLSTAEVAERLSAALSKPVSHVDVSDAEFRQSAQAAHMPPTMIETLAEYYAALKVGQMAMLSADVETVTHRSPNTYATWLSGALATA